MIGIIFISDLKYCPYLTKYTDKLDKYDKEYEVLFWKREKDDIKYPENYHCFEYESEKKRHPFFKSFDFIRFRYWLKKQIKHANYDKLIVLSTLSGILIYDILLKDYKNKYIFDIRDYSYEHIKLFYRIEKKIVESSQYNIISSEGFKNFLPKGDYTTVHNYIEDDLQYKREFKKKEYGSKLNVVFVGGLRYFNHQKNIVDRLKNDQRFNLIYHGGGIELSQYIQYCKDNNVNNVVFTGEYENEQRHNLLKDADILNNSYLDKKQMEVKYAISNKFYDGLIFSIPQLVEVGTYKSNLVQNLGIGISLDVEKNDFADKLYDYYMTVNDDTFNSSISNVLQAVIEEDKEYKEIIRKFI